MTGHPASLEHSTTRTGLTSRRKPGEPRGNPQIQLEHRKPFFHYCQHFKIHSSFIFSLFSQLNSYASINHLNETCVTLWRNTRPAAPRWPCGTSLQGPTPQGRNPVWPWLLLSDCGFRQAGSCLSSPTWTNQRQQDVNAAWRHNSGGKDKVDFYTTLQISASEKYHRTLCGLWTHPRQRGVIWWDYYGINTRYYPADTTENFRQPRGLIY